MQGRLSVAGAPLRQCKGKSETGGLAFCPRLTPREVIGSQVGTEVKQPKRKNMEEPTHNPETSGLLTASTPRRLCFPGLAYRSLYSISDGLEEL